MSEIIVIQKQELTAEISEILDKKLEAFFSRFPSQPQKTDADTLLSRKEAAKYLKISLNTLNEWTKEGIVKGHRISSRVRYKKSELELALNQIRSAR